MFLLLLILLADCRYLCTINTMQRYTSIGTALSASIFLSLLFCSSGVFPLNRFKNRICVIRAAKRISASIAVRNTTFPISVYSPHTAVTRSVRKRAFFNHFIVCLLAPNSFQNLSNTVLQYPFSLSF